MLTIVETIADEVAERLAPRRVTEWIKRQPAPVQIVTAVTWTALFIAAAGITLLALAKAG